MAYALMDLFINDIMARYSKKAQEKIGDVMHEMKKGKLKSGSGKKVTSRKQAIAIGISEAREKGAKVPSKKSAAKKSGKSETGAPKKTAGTGRGPGRPPKKAGAKKTPAKKSASPKKRVTKSPAQKRSKRATSKKK